MIREMKTGVDVEFKQPLKHVINLPRKYSNEVKKKRLNE